MRGETWDRPLLGPSPLRLCSIPHGFNVASIDFDRVHTEPSGSLKKLSAGNRRRWRGNGQLIVLTDKQERQPLYDGKIHGLQEHSLIDGSFPEEGDGQSPWPQVLGRKGKTGTGRPRGSNYP